MLVIGLIFNNLFLFKLFIAVFILFLYPKLYVLVSTTKVTISYYQYHIYFTRVHLELDS